MAPTFGMTGNWRDFERAFIEIGSQEFPRAVAYALDETAKAAAAEMTARLPTSLGHKVSGGWQPTAFMLSAIGYRRSGRYDAVTGVD